MIIDTIGAISGLSIYLHDIYITIHLLLVFNWDYSYILRTEAADKWSLEIRFSKESEKTKQPKLRKTNESHIATILMKKNDARVCETIGWILWFYRIQHE